MIKDLKKNILLTGLPPHINTFDLFPVMKIIHKILDINNIRLIIEDKNITKYLTPLPSVNAIISELEAISLYKAVYNLKGEGDVVEIGTWRGGSALILASGIKDSRQKKIVFSIDPFTKNRDKISMQFLKKDMKILGLKNLNDNFRYSRRLIKRFSLEKYIKINKNTSSNAKKGWKGKISFLFIDGNHKFQHVKSDFENWSPFISKGGIMALHDCINHDSPNVGLPGPSKVAKSIFKKTILWKFSGQVDSLIFFQKI